MKNLGYEQTTNMQDTVLISKLRYFERLYNRTKVEKIETCNTENPKEFWQHIKKLGPKKTNDIPQKVHKGEGFSTDEKDVCNKWQQDFSTLYNVPEDLDFDEEFYQNIVNEVTRIEENLTETNDFVNRSMSFDEIEKAVKKLKLKKAVGVDFIPNEVL